MSESTEINVRLSNTFTLPRNSKCLYGLCTTTDPVIRYVGITHSPRKRLHDHRRRSFNPRVFEWIKRAGHLNIVLKVFAIVEQSEAAGLESAFINKSTWPLLNREKYCQNALC